MTDEENKAWKIGQNSRGVRGIQYPTKRSQESKHMVSEADAEAPPIVSGQFNFLHRRCDEIGHTTDLVLYMLSLMHTCHSCWQNERSAL